MVRTIKIVNAIEGERGVLVTVDLDAANPDAPGDDPARLLDLSFGTYQSSKIGAESKVQYLQRLRGEIQIAARYEHKRRYGDVATTAPIPALIGADIS